MPVTSRALTAVEVGAEFGRSAAWIYANWERLVADAHIPPPLIEAGHLVWSAAQVYAYMDKRLPVKFHALVAAHRAALDAAAAAPDQRIAEDLIEMSRDKLNRRFEPNARKGKQDAQRQPPARRRADRRTISRAIK